MKKYFNGWRESRWWKITAVGIFALVLVLCFAGWRGNYQYNTTQTLQDVFRQARRENAARGGGKILSIYLEGERKKHYRAEYSAAELSDEQFARLQGSASSWVEQEARVTESVWSDVGSFCGTGMYSTKKWEDASVYQIGDRSRNYLLLENRREGKEYVAKLKNCYSDDDNYLSVRDILRDFIKIGGEEDISRITLEDTAEIQEGESNILAVYTREEDKKELYDYISGIPFYLDLEDELLCSFYDDEMTEEELQDVKGNAFYIEMENKQGEMVGWKYQVTDEVDYLEVTNEVDYHVMNEWKYVIGVPERERMFWRQLFLANARVEDTVTEIEIPEDAPNMLNEKPIIYLYPEKIMDIHVAVKNIDFTTVYPAYDQGWYVQAEPEGTLHLYDKDRKTLDRGREYYALYYEGYPRWKPDWHSGFTVKKKDYRKFLEEKLRILGLSDREAEEFIVYWLPQMEKYPAVDVRFTEQSLLDREVPLNITPKPDTLIRVFMQWRKHKDGENLPEQKLFPVARVGYTGVEWGGSEVTRDEG